MPQFRLTQKYAKDCRIGVLPDPRPALHPLDDWFIDVIRVNRKKIAMATHAQSTFTLFIPYAGMGGAAAVPEAIGIQLKEFLSHHNLLEWVEQVSVLFSETVTFSKTADRRILGHMNDFKWCVKGYTEHLSEPINWSQIANKINNMPVNFAAAGEYIYPTEMLGRLIGHQFKGSY